MTNVRSGLAQSAAKIQPVPKPAAKSSLQQSLFQTLLLLLPKSYTTYIWDSIPPLPSPPAFLPWLDELEISGFGPDQDPAALAGQL